MAYTKLRIETPNGPLDLIVRDTGDIGIRDVAGPINVPDAAEFVVNRVALNVYLEFEPSEDGYQWGGYPKGGHFGKRHSTGWNDGPSAKTHDKALSIVEAAIIEHHAEIVALMPQVRVQGALEAYELAMKHTVKADAALTEARKAEQITQRAFHDAIMACPDYDPN